mmetsp:Transcript_4340/g.7936  ORF Transcript_4340/g.7936 Transcript_4340/m.7936 type:complete len:291 (-) Transcript_4340:890-1762(-)
MKHLNAIVGDFVIGLLYNALYISCGPVFLSFTSSNTIRTCFQFGASPLNSVALLTEVSISLFRLTGTALPPSSSSLSATSSNLESKDELGFWFSVNELVPAAAAAAAAGLTFTGLEVAAFVLSKGVDLVRIWASVGVLAAFACAAAGTLLAGDGVWGTGFAFADGDFFICDELFPSVTSDFDFDLDTGFASGLADPFTLGSSLPGAPPAPSTTESVPLGTRPNALAISYLSSANKGRFLGLRSKHHFTKRRTSSFRYFALGSFTDSSICSPRFWSFHASSNSSSNVPTAK